ncbi:hypothetical protein AKJ45_01575 [candidate division MSBL1 archaeon SCGC-AAA261F19]|uniref:DUF434 domain-containing protein n=1 Tax=candidate division MSBL1 archaeon SCGC-AAA261F19 TaxID=1698275 RepID=A0A133VAJ5_9EURY|nr:hypothetical protein AKJ45_01575 [candidate division MSBL1 archaeon SCGC-AAA261F19]
MISSEIKEAIQDLRFLLNRGYPRASAVEFISDHYQLKLDQRHLLARCVFSKNERVDHQERSIDAPEVEGRKLGVDGYNVLITVESILEGKRVIICDDGFVRDLRAVFGKYKMSKATERALDLLLSTVSNSKPNEVALLFDKQVSKSGELASMARGKMDKMGIRGNARTVVGTDLKVRDFEVVSSSDRGIIEKMKAVWDIPMAILRREKATVLDLTEF